MLFLASADPLGTNPDENCQFFSIDTLGGDLRQLTHYRGGSGGGCGLFFPPGCTIQRQFREAHPGPDTVLFYSTCDTLGTNPSNGQLFAMRFDGTGLRQLTYTRGVSTGADGTVSAELPGPFAYP